MGHGGPRASSSNGWAMPPCRLTDLDLPTPGQRHGQGRLSGTEQEYERAVPLQTKSRLLLCATNELVAPSTDGRMTGTFGRFQAR